MLDLPNPTPEQIASPEFEAIWQTIKGWDIQVAPGDGYSRASGSHVAVILNALNTTEEDR
ncbi:MAG: hypothetical protein RIF41_07565 [Polyangiaceae bacterium]